MSFSRREYPPAESVMFWRVVPQGSEISILSPPAAHSGLALLQPALTMDVWQDGVGSS